MASTWYEEYLGAWNAKDSKAVSAWLADDGVYEDVTLGEVLKGPAELADFVERTVAMASDYSFEFTNALDTGDRYSAEWTLTGTHTGEMPGLPATGKPFRIRGISIGRRNADGKIVENRDYWNMADFLIQVGVLPPPA